MPASHRFIIIGAGSIGGGTGGTLARGGVDVVLVARGAHATALAERGLTLRTPDGVFEVPVASASGPDEVRLTTRDVLVFATKTHQLDAALQEWADQPVFEGDDVVGTAGESLPALTALNGVSAEDKALRYFARVFGVCVWMPASFPSPGEVIVRSWPVAGQFHIARWPAALTSAEDRALVDEIATGWSAAGILVQQPADVAPWKFNKLLSNLSNAIVALTGTESRDGELSAAVRREAEEVLALASIEWVSFETSKAARANGPTPRPVAGAEGMISNSTWQSLARKSGSVETDYLNGEIARIAHRLGTTAPLNAMLARLARDAASSGKEPGAYTEDELERFGRTSSR